MGLGLLAREERTCFGARPLKVVIFLVGGPAVVVDYGILSFITFNCFLEGFVIYARGAYLLERAETGDCFL